MEILEFKVLFQLCEAEMNRTCKKCATIQFNDQTQISTLLHNTFQSMNENVLIKRERIKEG